MELVTVSLLNGLSYGLLLFLLSAGFTLIFSMLGVLNFAHASFYMLGAYIGQAVAARFGFVAALLAAPLAVGAGGALFERHLLRRVHRHGHVAELLVTFGLSYLLLEAVQLVWGRAPLDVSPPAWLAGPAFTLVGTADGGWSLSWGAAPAAACAAGSGCSPFPATRAFTMAVALAMLALLGLLLTRTRVGLVLQAALTHPGMVEALGHDLPRLVTGVFGAGAALAALAGVIGGSTFVTEPAMAAALGPVIFVVVVVGGLGSLTGALLASLAIGLLQTFAVAYDVSLLALVRHAGWQPADGSAWMPLLRPTLAQVAPMLPYLLLVVVLAWRPQGLLGRREG